MNNKERLYSELARDLANMGEIPNVQARETDLHREREREREREIERGRESTVYIGHIAFPFLPPCSLT